MIDRHISVQGKYSDIRDLRKISTKGKRRFGKEAKGESICYL